MNALGALPRLVAAGDPLLDKIDAVAVAIVIVKTLVVFGLVLVSVLFMIWFERKVISDMQSRVGPDEAGRWGMLQSLADGIKIFFKEGFVPGQADRLVYRLAPYLAVVPAFLSFAIVPLGGEVSIAHRHTYLQLADPPIGILWLLAMSGVAVYGVMLAGWSSGSKYPLLGSVRASAQMVSYEAAMGLSVASVVLVAGSLSTRDVVAQQTTAGIGHILPNWNIIQLALVPFVIFVVAATAELNRPPFDLVEAESELVGGFNTEYASVGFALFYLAEFMNTVTMSAIIVTLFLGGPTGPWYSTAPILNWLVPILYFLAKELAFLFMYVWFRAALPRMRYDQLMDLGWKALIPGALGWLLIIATIRVVPGSFGSRLGYSAAAVVIAFGAYFMLVRAIGVGRHRTDLTRAGGATAAGEQAIGDER
ncbi:MAG TPA: NADH-quinone oxidoreductase subunit H [Candidatus Acidoferrum sp.]|nr:NADH-quinone oxidoreductase subunit H [Candidatus Acidoferrum sp.]